jgi:hypothetical protein
VKSSLTPFALLVILVLPAESWSQGGRGGGGRSPGGGHSSGGVHPAGSVHPTGSVTIHHAGGVVGASFARPGVRLGGFTTFIVGGTPQVGTRPWYDAQNYALWHQGYWPRYRHANNWLPAGRPFGWLLPSGESLGYDNPYFANPGGGPPAGQDYAKPLPGPSGGEPAPSDQEALELFDQAREAFLNNEYRTALKLADRAVAMMPSDATLHEFRALTLFALHEYRQAAAGLYAVLGSGPGWNWETMHSLYPDVKTYTEQLRALEKYQRDNPKSAEGHFLLAYHYLTMGHLDHGARQLETVVQILPNNALAAALLKSLRRPGADRPAPNP